MSFIKRLIYFSGGFLIGLMLLIFFLSGKRASCSYFPNSRVKKDILKKKIKFQDLRNYKDSIIIINSISNGSINFSKSNTKLKNCKQYYITNEDQLNKVWVLIKNCKNIATVYDYEIIVK